MTKEMKIGLGLAGVIIVLFGALFILNNYNYNQTLIREKNPNLTEEQRQAYDDRLTQADVQLAKTDLTDQSRYDLHMYKGVQLQGLGKYELAVQSFMEADKVMADNANTYVAMYTAQMDMNDIRGAQKSIRKAIELKPTDPDIWKKYIVMERERFGARDEQVRNMYQEALEKTNGHIDIVTSYAVFLEAIGDFGAAKGQWEKAIEINPANQSAYVSEIARIEAILKTQ